MVDVRIDEDLWNTGMCPEGVLEAWRLPDGSMVSAGAALADVRIEDALHEVLAPADGRLTILAGRNAVIEPGIVIGLIQPN